MYELNETNNFSTPTPYENLREMETAYYIYKAIPLKKKGTVNILIHALYNMEDEIKERLKHLIDTRLDPQYVDDVVGILVPFAPLSPENEALVMPKHFMLVKHKNRFNGIHCNAIITSLTKVEKWDAISRYIEFVGTIGLEVNIREDILVAEPMDIQYYIPRLTLNNTR